MHDSLATHQQCNQRQQLPPRASAGLTCKIHVHWCEIEVFLECVCEQVSPWILDRDTLHRQAQHVLRGEGDLSGVLAVSAEHYWCDTSYQLIVTECDIHWLVGGCMQGASRLLSQRMADELMNMSLDEAMPLARALGHYLNLTSIAELHHRYTPPTLSSTSGGRTLEVHGLASKHHQQPTPLTANMQLMSSSFSSPCCL